ncbi:hypothetical protein MNB_SV-15-614 [hydrothermal vent metagenome]|uniref:Uncharacterized protein n=1 Tax=hydrothermal vent metagenome TaxID=652676 RepID=A0A1W1EK08_9ZZZZ
MKGIAIFLAIIVGGYFFVMKVVDESKSYEDNSVAENGHASYYRKKVENRDKKYHKEDSLGQTVINCAGLTLEDKKGIWLRSPLKEEMISKFPNFGLMKMFVEARIEDADLRKIVLKQVNNVQDKIATGVINNNNDAKYKLGLLE